MRKKQFKNIVISIAAAVSLALGVYWFWIYPRHDIPVLEYHYINNDQGSSLFVRPENFERQMKYLKQHQYHVISLDEFIEGRRQGKSFPRNTVVITFDDGREDNYTAAYPILKKYGFPATIFVITGRVGTTYDGADYLKWEQIEEMARNGIDFGSHTQNHRYLPEASLEERIRELDDSKQELEEHIGKSVRHFCYPAGGFTDETMEAVQAAGYHSAVTTNRGFKRHHDNLYSFRRVKITNSDGVKPLHFRMKLSGYYYLLRRPKAGH